MGRLNSNFVEKSQALQPDGVEQRLTSVNNGSPVPSSLWKAWLSVLVAVFYGASPIDLLPDILPLIGWMDDVGVGGFLLMLAVVFFSRHVREKRQVKRQSTVIDVAPRN